MNAPGPRHMSFGAQVAIGFFGPGVVAFVLWLVALAVTRDMKGFLERGAVDLLALALTLALWIGLFRLSRDAAWRGVRIGLFLLAGAIVLWVAGCIVMARRLVHG